MQTTKHLDPTGPAIIVMIGPAGSGKSTWARARYPHEQRLSSDQFRALLTDSEDAQGVSKRAFELLRLFARERLELGRRAIIDATNVSREEREQWLEMARELDVPTHAVWFDVSLDECMERQKQRERTVHRGAVARHVRALEGAPGALLEEEWSMVSRVTSTCKAGELDEVLRAWEPPRLARLPRSGARLEASGVDIIGDVHGCLDELVELMKKLGWRAGDDGWAHPEGRDIVFVGDLTDRGPKSVGVLRLAIELIDQEKAVLVCGNHDSKLSRYMRGNKVQVDPHLATTVAELEALSQEDRAQLSKRFVDVVDEAPLWLLLGDRTSWREGTWAEVVVAHAAWRPDLRWNKLDKMKWYCLYGPSTGEIDENGYPKRLDWKKRYPLTAPLCVVGHTPFSGEPVVTHNTLCVDTACVFGHRLTALRWPENELVAVAAKERYASHTLGVHDQPLLHERPRKSREK